MNSIDEDAISVLGINPKLWKTFREMNSWKETRETQYKSRELPLARELPLERELPPARLVQGEFESITNPIDDREAFIRHKQAMAKRWFGYYRKVSDQQRRLRLIDQYNYLAQSRKR